MFTISLQWTTSLQLSKCLAYESAPKKVLILNKPGSVKSRPKIKIDNVTGVTMAPLKSIQSTLVHFSDDKRGVP